VGQGIITNLRVGANSGSIKAKEDSSKGSGTLNNIHIGTLMTKGTVSAANAGSMSITTLAGSIQVTNTLGNLSAGTVANTATLSAGHFGIVTAQSAAPTVEFVEPGVTRTLSVTSHNGGALPANYGFYYDGTGSGDPNVTLLFNAGNISGVGYDVDVLTNTVNKPGFDLAGIYAVGQADVHNIVVGGDLLLRAGPARALRVFHFPA